MSSNYITLSIAFFIASFVLVLVSCIKKTDKNTLTAKTNSSIKENFHFFSLNKAINDGQYDGFIEVGKLKQFGNFGLGSFEKLSYEFVMTDGIAYGIPDDGKLYTMPDSALIAYAVVTDFNPDTTFKIKQSMKKAELHEYLDTVLKKNSFAAIEITGTFSSIEYRSFHTQTKPYQATDDIPDVIFEKKKLEVNMIGYFTPKSAEVLNSPVYHFHFIDKDKTTGGHVLNFNIEKAEIKVAYSKGLNIHLPPDSVYSGIDLNE